MAAQAPAPTARPRSGSARLLHPLLFLLAGLLAVALEAAPLGVAPDAWPSPDLLFLLAACTVIRRPEAAPLPAVAALGLLHDLIADHPAGAGLLALVLASEFLRLLGPALARRSPLTEWTLVVLLLGLGSLLQWALVLASLAHPPYLIDLARQWLTGAALYPLLTLALPRRRTAARPAQPRRGG